MKTIIIISTYAYLYRVHHKILWPYFYLSRKGRKKRKKKIEREKKTACLVGQINWFNVGLLSLSRLLPTVSNALKFSPETRNHSFVLEEECWLCYFSSPTTFAQCREMDGGRD